MYTYLCAYDHRQLVPTQIQIKPHMLRVPVAHTVLVNNSGVEESRRLPCGLVAETAGDPAAGSKDMVALLCSYIFRCNQCLYLSCVWVALQQPEPVVEERPEEVLLRANAKGILDRIGSNQQPARKQKHGHTHKTSKQANAHPSHSHLSVAVRARNQETKANGTALCSHHESSNKRQLSQGGHDYFSLISCENDEKSVCVVRGYGRLELS